MPPPESVPGAGQTECETKQRLVEVSQQRLPPPGTAPHTEVHCESLVQATEHAPPSVSECPASCPAPPVSRGGTLVS